VTFATPMIGNAMIMNFFDRSLGTFYFGKYVAGVFVGGNPLLYQNLFWFYSHPAVYVMILPAMGIVSEILPKMVKRPIFGYRAMAYSILAIALLGFTVWMHHMFATGTDTRIRLFFMMMTMIIGVPTGVKIFNWIMTMWGGVMRFEAPLLFCIAFVANFLIGGIDGVFMASVPVDYQLHMTYWVVSHLHYVLFGGAVLGVFAGIYYWLPLMSGKMYHRKMAMWHFWLTVIGLNVVFMTMHFLGTAGMPRRVFDYLPKYASMNMIATVGAFVLAVGQLPFLYNIWWTMRRGARTPSDPWNDAVATEWGGLTPGATAGHVGAGPAHAIRGGGKE
jgi:cytochrome c oxidase subunit I